MVAVLDKSSKSFLCHNIEECDEQKGDHVVANEEAIKISTWNDGRNERFGETRRYFKREQGPFRKWWNNHILSNTAKNEPM